MGRPERMSDEPLEPLEELEPLLTSMESAAAALVKGVGVALLVIVAAIGAFIFALILGSIGAHKREGR